MSGFPVRGYRQASVPIALVAVLALTWSGSGSLVWAERKAPVGQEGVTDDRAVAGRPQTRPSVPVQPGVGVSPKQEVGKSFSPGKPGGPLKKQPVRRAHRRTRGAKRLKPQISITPKPDVSFHGLLEQPQRYFPHYEPGKGGATNPNTGALLHDHFQELDKNRDGSIDPFERALGRLDIDRDLADRQWQ